MKTPRKRGYRIFSRTAKITAQRVDELAGWQLTSPKGTHFVSDDFVEQLAALPPRGARAGMTAPSPAHLVAQLILPAIEAARAKLAISAAGMNYLPMPDWDDIRYMDAFSVACDQSRATMAQRRGHDLEKVSVTGKGVNVRGWFVAFGAGYGDTVSDGCVGFTADGVNLRLPADDGTPGELVTVPYLEPPSNSLVMETCSLNEHRRGLRVGWHRDPEEEAIFDALMKPYWDRYNAERTSPEVRVAADTKSSMDTSHPAASWIPLSLPSLFAPETTRAE